MSTETTSGHPEGPAGDRLAATAQARAPVLGHQGRSDPYFGNMWGYPERAQWPRNPYDALPRTRRVRQLQGLAGDEALKRILQGHRTQSPWRIEHFLCVLAVLLSWHVCTPDQIADFVGDKRLRQADALPYLLLLQAELIRPGVVVRAGRDTTPQVIWRVNNDAPYAGLLGQLSQLERLAVTGGLPWSGGRVNPRHDVLAAEVALRLAEHHPQGTVLGERFCQHTQVAPQFRPERQRFQHGAADLIYVRPDGLRIAIELTATVNRNSFRKKVRTWAELLSESALDESGLVVVFLLAPSLEAAGNAREDLDRKLRRDVRAAVAQACRARPGVSFDPTAARIGVATWRDWFPAVGVVSEDFMSLAVDRYAGSKTGQRWERHSFLGAANPTPSMNLDKLREVIEATKLLGQTPVWLRRDLDPKSLETLLPSSTFAFTRSKGTANLTTLPPRLLGLAKGESA